MVNSVSSVNALNQITNAAKEAEVKKLVSYINGESLKQVPDTFESTTLGGAKSAGIFNGIPFLRFLKNKKIASKMFNPEVTQMNKLLADSNNAILETSKSIFKKGGLSKYIQAVDANTEIYNSVSKATKFAKKSSIAYKRAEKVAEKLSKKTGNKFINWIRNHKLVKLTNKAGKFESLAEEATKKALSKTTENAAVKAAGEGVKAASKFGKVGKLLKKSGAGFMLVFSGIMETFTEVVPTFKELGKEKGMKQVGKSAVKVVGDTAGFIAGQAVGKYAGALVGAKIGAAVGTVFPGVGNAVGAVVGGAIGLIGGLLGSFVAGKITKAVTGPSEREKAKEEQTKAAVNEISNDKNSIDAIKQAAAAKIQQEIETNGALSEDSYIALDSLSKLEGQNPFAAKA